MSLVLKVPKLARMSPEISPAVKRPTMIHRRPHRGKRCITPICGKYGASNVPHINNPRISHPWTTSAVPGQSTVFESFKEYISPCVAGSTKDRSCETAIRAFSHICGIFINGSSRSDQTFRVPARAPKLSSDFGLNMTSNKKLPQILQAG